MIHWATVLQRSEEMSFKLNLLKLPKCQNQGLFRIKCSAQLRCEFPIWKVIRYIFLGHIISSPTLLPTFFALSLRLTIFVFFFLAVDFDFVLGESKTKVWNRGPKEICVARKCVFYWTQVLFYLSLNDDVARPNRGKVCTRFWSLFLQICAIGKIFFLDVNLLLSAEIGGPIVWCYSWIVR